MANQIDSVTKTQIGGTVKTQIDNAGGIWGRTRFCHLGGRGVRFTNLEGGVDARNGSGSNTQCDRAFPASPGARGDPAGLATLGTRWVRRPVGATGLIDGRHVALGPVGGRRLRLVGCQYNLCQTTDDHLGHDMEAGAGVILAEGVQVLRAVATRVPGSDRVIASSAKWVFPKQQRFEPRRLSGGRR
ncbi:hypothetical protein TIFTF001_026105 [Ficus carica]|uniref:Uncharacterized protein n=1 Tax=Ficus carica TaxID=3494 RepID=A0AA88AQV2_FICCA|nr:hypothetical protein TIFTF001_026105 [Ficus carica]